MRRPSGPTPPAAGPARLSPPRGRALCSGLGAIVTVLWLAPTAQAQGIPVIDVQNVVQATLQAKRALEQIDQLSKQYGKQVEQLSVAMQQRDALVGGRAMGQLLNGAEERAARRAIPSTFEELLRTLASANGSRSLQELQALYDARNRDLGLVGHEAVNPERPEGRTARLYARERSETLAKLAVSDKALADSARRVESYEELMRAIDASPDLKASTDLANRILAENGLVMNELLRLQAVSVATAAANRAHELVNTSNVAEIAVYESVPIEALSDLASAPPGATALEIDR